MNRLAADFIILLLHRAANQLLVFVGKILSEDQAIIINRAAGQLHLSPMAFVHRVHSMFTERSTRDNMNSKCKSQVHNNKPMYSVFVSSYNGYINTEICI